MDDTSRDERRISALSALSAMAAGPGTHAYVAMMAFRDLTVECGDG
jgi:hypothetical protein